MHTAHVALRSGALAVLFWMMLAFAGFTAEAGQGAVVVVDPGHGGEDPGAVDEMNGILEKTINLQVAKKMQARLETAGYRVMMTRDQDDAFCHSADGRFVKRWISLEERVALANHNAADVFVSIHANSFHDRTCAGAEIFYHRASEQGRILAETFQSVLRAANPPVGCRVKPSDYYVLRSTRMPAVLVEMGYITNDDEAKLLLEPTYQERLAEAFTAAVNQYLEQAKNKRGAVQRTG